MVERNLIVSILKLTKNKDALIEDVREDSRIPSDTLMTLLEKLQNEDLLILNRNLVSVDSEKRLKLAVKAVSFGADVEAVSNFLHWQEFESIAATTFRNNGYEVVQNLRFKHTARRWEIDVVGCKKPLVVCADCKDFHHGLSPSAMRRIVEAQVERVRALADALPALPTRLECAKWDKAKFVPVVLVLIPSRFKFCDDVPIVPVLQLQDFLQQLPLEIESLKYFQKGFAHLSDNLQEWGSGEFQRGNHA
jgi:Holliday junction resolvase-like predicted endonuclease